MMKKLFRKIKDLSGDKKEDKSVLPTTLWESATVELAETLYKTGKHKELAVILPHLRNKDSPLIKKLLEGRLLTIGNEFSPEQKLPVISIGADPEFILEDEKGEIALFSSKHARGSIAMSQATLGADYGLLEFRPPYQTTTEVFIDELDILFEYFKKYYTKLKIKEEEAVTFEHKMARIRTQLEDENVDFGLNIPKNFAPAEDIDITDESSYHNVSLSAYDEPVFKPSRTDILSAGGHIHIGGSFIRMLSLQQLKEYIRRIDGLVGPICTSVETPAAALRKEVYGVPGEFRIKPYGVEYRTPSNAIFWPRNKRALVQVLKIMVEEAQTFLLK